ncbi:M20/M25/M40 family metallo-hydrolase [Candidatus Dojkabacteria bacterium]|uniref:M20/M25/M40 family metallo-hydrolase n=1 Tax=Candidatus Dojkabacteria bacterium TaxID=2099670 RepID=A0A955LAT8_9BACT|nr:M20/M25/M40 family metallo-hydrolase [Candidatus Dojkabacteria bacterium]
MKKLLIDLLKFKTTADNNSELHKAVDYVDSLLNEYNVHTSRFVSNDKPSIVITTQFTKSPKILLMGHLDVVPGNYEKAFEPFEKDGNIFARGASDMKGTVAAMISAFQYVAKNNPEIDLGLMLTTDEEQGGENGAEFLLKEKEYSAEIVFLPDGGINWNVCTDEKGLWHVFVRAQGKYAHGSRPWLGDNAINKCWKTYRDIRDVFREKWGKLREYDSWKPTINLGSLHGGEAANTVPKEAEMKLDIRFPSPVTPDEMMDIIEQASKTNDVEFEIITGGHPSHTDKENSYVQKWQKLVDKKLGKGTVEFEKAFGGSDGRHFSKYNIPVLMSLPNVSQQHIEDEWIDYKSLEDFRDILINWIIEK